jgi:MOSC domain-containing protein YiiM
MSGRSGKLISINSSGGGVPKRPVLAAVVNSLGLEDDRHIDKNHGGPDRAICIYPIELIKALRAEGHPIDIGTAGENFTVEDLDWSLVKPGAKIRIGNEVRLEVISYTSPCKTIAGSFTGGLFKRISEKVHPGWSRVYARVITPGRVESGSSITLE